MKYLDIFLYEWKHFVRSPYKVVALLLFVLASVYGLHNGASLYKKQMAEIEKIDLKIKEQREKIVGYFDKGEKGPSERPWIDVTTPFWATWNVSTYHFKTPSPALVYSIGQAEQYGFYKQISVWSSPYDADMAEEISNPERLQTGTLDFAFSILFLLPLLLLILLYNIKSSESEQGFLQLIYVQTASKNSWLVARVSFYFILVAAVVLALVLYGAVLTGVIGLAGAAFGQMIIYTLLSLGFWTLIYYIILQTGSGILGNTLKMTGVWLLFAFIIPATVHQWVSIVKPTNLMTDIIDVNREDAEKIYELPTNAKVSQLFGLIPALAQSKLAKDTTQFEELFSYSSSAINHDLMNKAVLPIALENDAKNTLIKNTYWFNPITYFQNKLNSISGTHYQDYQTYRDEIQQLINTRIKVSTIDLWNGVKVDKAKYLAYETNLKMIAADGK